MRVPIQTPRPAGRVLATGLIALATALAACTSSAAAPPASPAASASAPAAPAASPSGPSTGSTPSASALPSASSADSSPAASMVPSLGDLKLLWQKAGSTSVKTETYWPAIDPLTGDVWVAFSFQNAYWIFKPDGTYVGTWGTAGSGPGQLALTTHDPHPDGVGAIAFAPDGSFYVADNGNFRVEEFDKDRHFVRQWGSFGTGNGQFVSPKGIATDGKLVFVADDPRGDMQVFDLEGHLLRSFPFTSVLFSLSPHGHLIVVDDNSSELDVTDSAGNVIAHYPIDFASYGPDASVTGSPTGGAQAIEERDGRILVPLGNDSGPQGLLEVDQQGRVVRRWSTGSETMALSSDGASLYMAATGPSLTGWPFFRKYALPKG